jgi:rubrerythrin
VPQQLKGRDDIIALQKRYLTFVDKLIARGHELVAEAVPQIQQMVAASGDIADQAPGRVFSAVLTQVEGLGQKATKVYDEQFDDDPDFDNDADSDLWDSCQSVCAARNEHIDSLYLRWRNQLERALEPDYESEYQKVLAESETTKGSYRCQQCGSPLPIDRIFVIDVYVPCPQCQTQNHFAPSTAARTLDHIALPLARKRHVEYLDANDAIDQRRDQLEYRWYDIRMLADSGDQAAKAEMQQLCTEMLQLAGQADRNGQNYLAAVYYDLQQMLPDSAAHYKKLYDEEFRHHQKEAADTQKDITKMMNEARR